MPALSESWILQISRILGFRVSNVFRKVLNSFVEAFIFEG